jgi:hypothetical protein
LWIRRNSLMEIPPHTRRRALSPWESRSSFRIFVSVGKSLTAALCSGTSLVGVFMSHLPRVLSERRCLIVEGGATLRGMRILHHSALLPLSEDGVTISHVLGAANYRPLAAEEAWEAGVAETRWV